MTEYNEVVTVNIKTGGNGSPYGCPHCGKSVGDPVVPFDSPAGTPPQAFIVTSADLFCSVECRRDFHLARGCQWCRARKPSGIGDPGWRFGSFMSYSDTDVTCPRCVTEWPKYETYVAVVEDRNAAIKREIQHLREQTCEPNDLWVEDSGEVYFYRGGEAFLSLEDLEAAIRRVKGFDVESFLERRSEAKRIIVDLENDMKQPLAYQRWLEGER